MYRRGLEKRTPTTCPKAGIKIHESNNDSNNNNNNPLRDNNNNQSQLSKPVSFQKCCVIFCVDFQTCLRLIPNF